MAASADFPVAILAGGLATRLLPLTERVPKLLVDVAGEPFFEHQLRLLRRNGLTRLVLCVGHLGEQIVARYGDGSAHGVRIDYVFDGPAALGTGGALVRALPHLGAVFYVLYGDSYLPIDYQAAGRALTASGRPALMTVYENCDAGEPSNVRFENGCVLAYAKTDRPSGLRHIDYGLGVYRASAFDDCPRGAAFDLSALQARLAAAGRLAGLEVFERYHEIGSPAGLAALERFLQTKASASPGQP